MHWHGLRLFRVLAAAVARAWHYRGQDLSRHYARARTFHDHLRLAHCQHGLDVHLVFCGPGRLGGTLGRLAGAGRPAQSRCRRRMLLGGRPRARRHRRLHPSALADVARRWRRRRCRSRPRLHLAGLDADQMVPRSPRHGDRLRHCRLRRRRHDRRAAREPSHQLLQDAHGCRRLADLRCHGRGLSRLHDDRRLCLPGDSGRLAGRRRANPRR